MIDVCAVRFGQPRALDEENVLSVELRAARKIIGAGDHSIVDHKNFVVHVIVAHSRRVRR